MDKTYRASYTVEGAWIISICILLVFFTLSVAIGLYQKAISYTDETMVEEMETATLFRRISLGKELISDYE